jgi:hypothetical protein
LKKFADRFYTHKDKAEVAATLEKVLPTHG